MGPHTIDYFWFLVFMYIIRIYINDLVKYECQNRMDLPENVMDTFLPVLGNIK